MLLRFPTTKFSVYFQIRRLTASNLHPPQQPISPVNLDHLLRVCTVVYQQQDTPDLKLHAHLKEIDFHLSHEFFLQVCNKFPYSWKPVYRFFQYTKQSSHPALFAHTPITVNKLIDIFGKAKNIQLLWDFLQEAAEGQLVNSRTFMLAAKAFAEARHIKKCVGVFHLINSHSNSLFTVETLNLIVEMLCLRKLVDEAKDVVTKLKPCIKPNEATYGHLIIGFCRGGDLVRATKVWNMMVEEGLEPEVEAYEEIIETFFKTNRFDDGIKLFKSLRTSAKMQDFSLSTYKTPLTWLCKKGNVEMAQMVLAEMIKRAIEVDQPSLGALVYGFLIRKRIKEGYMVLEGIREPEISVYHGLIKGLLRLRRAGDATQVFREMTERGCEPIMHTYIMLLQGHLGKRGRKGRDTLVNFETIFVGGLLKVGKMLEATKYVERMMWGGVEVPRFDYNRFLHSFSNEEGALMFEEVAKKMKQLGMVDLGDIFLRYGEKMTTRDRRKRTTVECCWGRKEPGKLPLISLKFHAK